MSDQERRSDRKHPHVTSALELRVEALEAQMKALVDLFKAMFPDVEIASADPYSDAFVKFRQRADGVLR